MTNTELMTDEQFQAHVLTIIGRELGIGGLARFVRLNHSGQGDYTRDRHLWLDNPNTEQLPEPTKGLNQTRAA